MARFRRTRTGNLRLVPGLVVHRDRRCHKCHRPYWKCNYIRTWHASGPKITKICVHCMTPEQAQKVYVIAERLQPAVYPIRVRRRA